MLSSQNGFDLFGTDEGEESIDDEDDVDYDDDPDDGNHVIHADSVQPGNGDGISETAICAQGSLPKIATQPGS